MARKKSILDPKKRYLQVALNGTLEDARSIISSLPKSDRIIVEAGTPFIKEYGAEGIRKIVTWYRNHLWGTASFISSANSSEIGEMNVWQLYKDWRDSRLDQFWQKAKTPTKETRQPATKAILPYVVADLKTMDRGQTEVTMAADAGASAAIALGAAPVETLNAFIEACEAHGLDSMIDMMNIDYPLSALRALKKVPNVVILHRGVDEEHFNKEKMLPLHEIRRIKGAYDIMISIAGGDTIREVQRSIFNDADIVVVWKSVYQSTAETATLVEGFLKEIK